jgi:SOS-response transcriptional repressor LexA
MCFLCSGAADSEQAAEELCTALQTAGVVLRHKDMVYLNAEEVSQLISMVSASAISFLDRDAAMPFSPQIPSTDGYFAALSLPLLQLSHCSLYPPW